MGVSAPSSAASHLPRISEDGNCGIDPLDGAASDSDDEDNKLDPVEEVTGPRQVPAKAAAPAVIGPYATRNGSASAVRCLAEGCANPLIL